MKAPGHLGLALLLAAPLWLAFDVKRWLSFVALALPVVMLPDVDLVLRNVLPNVHHHGVTHTFLFVAAASMVLGATFALVHDLVTDESRESASLFGFTTLSALFAFATVAFFFGSGTHIVADMLSAPDIAQAVEPLWPVYERSLGLDVVPVHSDAWNFGLFGAGVATNALFLTVRLRRDDDARRSLPGDVSKREGK